MSRARRLASRVRRRLSPPVTGAGTTPALHRRPPRQRVVVVVTYGRSGSTLVQGLLNTLPRTVVRGESNFWVMHSFRAWDRLREFRGTHLKHETQVSSSAFYGLQEMRPAVLVTSTRAVLLDHLLGATDPATVDVLGFKEVAWHRLRRDEVTGFFDFFDRVFPGCLYVLNERDHDRVPGSGFWKGHEPEDVLAKIRRVEHMQQHLRRTRPGRTLDLRYERITSADPAVADAELRALAEFVHGSCPPELLERLRETREVGHGPFPFGTSRTDQR